MQIPEISTLMEKAPGRFYQWSKEERWQWLLTQCPHLAPFRQLIESCRVQDAELRELLEQISENHLTPFPLPLGLCPELRVNHRSYQVPMVSEESSVVAAASKGAKFWNERGGFITEVHSTTKLGHVHFFFRLPKEQLEHLFQEHRERLIEQLVPFYASMRKRGAAPLILTLKEASTQELPHYFLLELELETCDAMGANLINTLLEHLAQCWKQLLLEHQIKLPEQADILMSILSNRSHNCLVTSKVSAPLEQMTSPHPSWTNREYAQRLVLACAVAQASVERAVTHNKGIMNGVDALVLATGNDFRAVEACVHSFAARNGQYRGLTSAWINDDTQTFHLELTLPLALGTVGGLTTLHPLANFSLAVLGFPSAAELMSIACSLGLAQNFSAMSSLVTSGIQQGHMKLHLFNILQQLGATPEQKKRAQLFFQQQVVSFQSVRNFLTSDHS